MKEFLNNHPFVVMIPMFILIGFLIYYCAKWIEAHPKKTLKIFTLLAFIVIILLFIFKVFIIAVVITFLFFSALIKLNN